MASPYPSLRWWLLPFIRSRIWTVRGLEHIPASGAFIIAPNHQAWIDSPIVAAAVYRRLVKPLKYVAMSGKYSWLGGMPIDQHHRHAVLDVAVEFLQRGFPVVIFPEGNSNQEMELRTGKTGAARLALRTGLPVIPVGIKGTRGIKPWQGFFWFWSIWRPCHVAVGAPIQFPTHELTGNDDVVLEQTTNQILQAISTVSGKPMPGEGPSYGRRGFAWFFIWRIVRPLVQWRVRIIGKNNLPEKGPYILAGNHTSYFDAPTVSMAVMHVTGLLPMYPTKQTVAEGLRRLLGQGALQNMGVLPLDNNDKAKVLGPAIEHLHRGGVIGIFPEGRRNIPRANPNWATELLKGKTGAVRLMLATGAPIIPVGLRVPRGINIPETVMRLFQVWRFLRVEFGQPIVFTNLPTGEPTKEDLDRLTTQMMTQIATLTGKAYPY